MESSERNNNHKGSCESLGGPQVRVRRCRINNGIQYFLSLGLSEQQMLRLLQPFFRTGDHENYGAAKYGTLRTREKLVA